jgi:uncharacterized membrane protein
MRFLTSTFLRGLATVVPAAATVYILWWLGSSAESGMRDLMTRFLPQIGYVRGLGLLLGFSIVFLIGLVMRAWLAQRLLGLGEKLLARIPLVKTVYGSLKDLAGFFGDGEKGSGLSEVVMVEHQGTKVMGFVSSAKPEVVTGKKADGELVAVYLPMSYQLGGFLVFVPRASVEKVPMTVEQGLRFVLTAGVGGRREERHGAGTREAAAAEAEAEAEAEFEPQRSQRSQRPEAENSRQQNRPTHDNRGTPAVAAFCSVLSSVFLWPL